MALTDRFCHNKSGPFLTQHYQTLWSLKGDFHAIARCFLPLFINSPVQPNRWLILFGGNTAAFSGIGNASGDSDIVACGKDIVSTFSVVARMR
ncbi:hypothetical protein ACFL9S_11230 [Erwinia sp. AnSW2-5]|uniref:hypothetical protein n=1 Tax=Erwinia sp. AnSW2-5 TaxID=3367692 RepID=UPI00385B025D